MTQDQWNQLFTPGHLTAFSALFTLLVLWSLAWKGIALWKAARNGATAWYVVLLILNTVGILEILYIFVFGKKKSEN